MARDVAPSVLLMLRAIILVPLLAAAAVGSAFACDCPQPPPALEAARAVDSVFVGKVLSVKRHSEPGDSDFMLRVKSLFGFEPEYGTDERVAAMAVETPIKGVTDTKVVVHTSWDDAMCGYPFEAEKTYLVYAKVVDGRLWSSLCSRCAPAQTAADEVAELLGARQ